MRDMEEPSPVDASSESGATAPVAARKSALFRGAVALAAGLAGVALVGRGSPPFVTWELVRAHSSLAARPPLELSIWTSDPHVARRWLDARGTEAPLLPGRTAGLELVGLRYSVFLDRVVVHALYGGETRSVSVFYLRRPARIGQGYRVQVGGHSAGLFTVGDTIVGVVADTPEEVTAFEESFARVWVEGSKAVGRASKGV